MTTVTTYIAEDGTKFDSEWECMDYEAEQEAKEYADTAFLFDDKGERLSLHSDSFNEAFFIKATTNEAAQFMAERFEGWSTPWYDRGIAPQAGMWVFFNEEWTALEEIEHAYKMMQKLM